jgi:hypothetical protein
MSDKKQMPPPLIDSAKLLAFAYNDEEVEFTDKIDLFVGEIENLKRIGEMPCLAICSNYLAPNDILLFFCNAKWESQGVIEFKSIEEAKSKAERGYPGISKKWEESPYTIDDVNKFLRDVYEVDPSVEWWK